MEYDVTGTLKIDTEAFEEALKDAQKRIDNFKKDLESLGSLAKEIGFPELDKSLKDINKQLDNVEVNFGNIDKSADKVVESVGNLKNETDNVTKSVKNLKNETKQIDKSVLRRLTSIKRKMEELNESMALTKSKIKLLNGKSSGDRRSLNYDREVGLDNEELEKEVAKHNELIGKEIQQYNRLKEELNELNKEYDSLMSSDNSLEGKLTQLKHLVLESEKANKNMKKLTQQAKKEKELWFDTDGDESRLHSKNYQGLKKLSDEQVKLFTEYRTRIKTLLSELVNDFGLSFSEIEKIMGKEISTKSVKDMASNLDSQIDFAKNRLDSLKRNLSTLQEKYSLIQKQITSQSLFHIGHSRRNKDGSIHKRDQYNFERRIFPKQQEAEKILEKDFPRLANEIKTAETELAKLEQLREKLISSSNFGKNADYVLENLEKHLRKKKESIEFWVNSIRELNEKINSTTNLEEKHSLKNNRNRETNILKERVKEYKQIKAEMESLSNIKELDKPKESLDNATKSAEHLKEKMNEVSQSSKKTADTVTTLDDFYDKATVSAEKLTAETRKTNAELGSLQRRINKIKLDRNFTKDFYSAVRFADGGNGVELKPVYEKLKKDYKDLVKNKAEFEKLFSNAVRRTNTRLYPSRDPDKHTNIGGRNFGYIDRKNLISLEEFTKLMDKARMKIKELKGESLNPLEGEVSEINRELKKTVETSEQLDEPFDQATSSAKKLEEYIDQATASAEKLNAETRKTGQFISPDKSFNDLHNELMDAKSKLYDLKNEAHRIREEESGSVEELKKATTEVKKQRGEVNKLQKDYDKVQDNVRKLTAPLIRKQEDLKRMLYGDQKPSLYDDELMVGSTGMKKALTEARAEYRELLKQKKEIQAEIDKIIADNGGVLTPEITEANKKLFEELHHIDSLRQDRLEDTKSYPKEIERVEKKIEQLDKEIQSYYSDAGKYLEGIGEGAKLGEEKISEFDAKLKQQHEGLDKMLNESTTKATEGIKKVETSFDKGLNNIRTQISQVHQRMEGLFQFFRSGRKLDAFGKWFDPQINTPSTNRWIHEQLSTTRDFFKGFTQGFAKLKKEQSESVSWMKEFQVKMNELKYGSRDFLNTEIFAKANSEAKKYLASLGKVSASTNQWVNQEITDFNRFSKAVQTSTMEAENRLKRLEQTFATMSTVGFRNDVGIGQLFSGTGKSQNMKRMLEQQLQYAKMGNATGVGFAGSNQFQNLNKSMQEYNRLSNVANLNTQRMGLGFEKFGQYTEKASSNVRSLGGVLRSLRTTMSMIGGMFVWEFAFKIMDSARATISAKSEMESYYKTLHMGSKEIASFNKSLDNTISTYQKMNKFQLGETIASLGVEFKMSTDEMNQVMKVAPMIVNEYLRAGRSTEEAILAIKDISQGEFLRLSRETGVGAKEIKEAGWSGDNKDIISLYQALEKIGTARHWDVFASKAQSLNDVMLITENRMTEFVTLLSDAVTPAIVTSFNALGDAFNSASRWYEGLGSYDKAIVQITTLGTVGLTTAGVFNSHLVPAVKNVGTNLISSFLGVDSAIAKEKGLAQAIAHETAVERIANIERKGGQKVLHAKIMTLKAEELANSLGMNTTKLRMRYENLQQMAMKRGTTELKARELAQRSLILAEEQNITTTQAMNILLEEEALAEMGTAKALLVRKLGLDANIVSEEGMIVAMNEKIAESFPYISSLVSETLATLGLESATASLVVTLGLLVAPLIAVGLAVAPLIASFLDLQKSYETLADTFENGQQRINELEQKQKGYQKTIDELGSKTNLTAQEEAKLQEARDGLTYTTEALEDATNRYNKSVEYTHIVNKNIEKVEGERAKNLKEINKELEKQTGKKETIDSSYGMTTAYKEQYRTLQVIAWEEEHRPERFKKLSEGIKNTSKDQEEYNKKIQEFGNDWNQAYSDMEDAQLKRIDPNSDAFTRLWSYFDESWAIAKMDWIEFWADPFASISGELGFDGLSQSFNDALAQMGQDWDNFWQPITDFFNNFSVDGDFDPFAGLKDWWGGTNDWLSSIMPDISVDSIKQWFGKNVREPFQKAWSDFWKNPFGGGENKQGGQGGTPTGAKTINLSGMFKFNFGSLKEMFNSGFRGALGGIPNILSSAGQLWSRLGLGNGQKTVTSIKQGLQNLKSTVQQKFNEGANSIRTIGNTWKSNAHSTAKGVYDKIKSGLGNPAKIVREKLNEVTQAINSIRSVWGKAINNAVSVFNVDIPFFNGGIFGRVYGYGGSSSKPRKSRVRLNANAPVYGGGSNVGFETVLRTMLTKQGFRSPSSYQFYPNSQKTTQETWDSGKANCYDGASLIVALGQMFGLKGRIITGNWNGTGHAGAIVGGKLYDMTQFQRRGVFRGTQGVHFGSKGNGSYKGASTEETKKEINIHITNDLSNARIYGIDDLDNHIKQTTERTFYELNSTDGAIGY